MNATCQQCDTVFRIDPAKVPTGRVRVRCSICRAVFEIRDSGDGDRAAAATGASAASTSQTSAAAESGTGVAREDRQDDTIEAAEGSGSLDPSSEAVDPGAPAAERPSTTAASREAEKPTPPRQSPSFGSRDPDARARRLARALVSDMATYHPDRRNRALEAGNLKDEFREEIKKSWQEYVEQVGLQTARGTPHFRDALNDILAKGNRIF